MAEEYLTSTFKKDHYVICKLNFEKKELVHVTKKGMLTIIECCEKHGKTEDELYTYLNECISTNPVETVLVHSDCCRNFTDKKDLDFKVLLLLMKFQVQRDCGPVQFPSAGRMIVCSVLNLLSWILVTHRENVCTGYLLFPCVAIF